MSDMSAQDARVVLTHFIARNKANVGLSKSEALNRAVVDITLRDGRVMDLLRSFRDKDRRVVDGTVHSVERPQLMAYLRGVRIAQTHFLQLFRKSVADVFGRHATETFDNYYERSPLLPREGETGFWPRFSHYLAAFVERILEDFFHDRVLKDYFWAVVKTIKAEDRRQKAKQEQLGGALATTEARSLPLAFEQSFAQADVYRLFNAAYTPPLAADEDGEPVTGGGTRLDLDYADYLETRHELVSEYARKDVSRGFVKHFLALCCEQDKPKEGLGTWRVFKEAERQLKILNGPKCPKKRGLFDSGVLSKEECARLKEEYEALAVQAHWFGLGCLWALDNIMLGECKKMAAGIKSSQAFHALLQGDYADDMDAAKSFYMDIILRRMQDGLRERFLRLVQDFKNEAVIKEFGDDAWSVKLKKGSVVFKVGGYVKHNSRFVHLLDSILALNPTLERQLIHCPSVAEVLAANLPKYGKKDPQLARTMLKDNRFVRYLGEVIHIDYATKARMIQDPRLFHVVWLNKENSGFPEFMRLVANTAPKLRQELISQPLMLERIWSICGKEPDTAIFEKIAKNPGNMEFLRQHLTDTEALRSFAKDLKA